MMMMSNLPGNLVKEILTRVPLKSMRAVRLTSKKWNALSKNRSFKKNLDREEAATKEGESQVIVMMDYNVYLMSIVVNENPSNEFKGKLTCLNELEQVKISQIYHCDGLLLCILKDDDTKVVVWNPYLAQTKWIKTRYTYRDLLERLHAYSYAIGYENKKNKSCRTYKILRFIYDIMSKEFCWYEIYDFDSGLRKRVDNRNWSIKDSRRGVSVKGNTYWLATKKNTFGVNEQIICFDFTRERFGPLLPLPFIRHLYFVLALSCVREEKLAALCVNTFTIDIWITTKIEAENVFWSKFLRVDLRPHTHHRIFHQIFIGNFLINEEKKVAMVLNKSRDERLKDTTVWSLMIFGEDGYYKELGLGETSNTTCCPLLCSYVPSVVQINQPK